MISLHTIQQITSRIDITDVIGEFVKLKKRGTNYLGLCPFHNERTPSFTVSPSKDIYKCFGCGKSGNSITFLMEHEKYSYAESLRWLANRYNIEIEETEISDEQKQQQLVSDSLYIINSFAQKFFTEQLFHTAEGQSSALTYLYERGFNDNIIKKFQLGYNPQAGNAFASAALGNQFNKNILLKSGLVAERNTELTDNYRSRILFPIHSNTGKIIGFGARKLNAADKSSKYINTPENELYIKSRILYGIYFARQEIDKRNECLLVEGYTDVISLCQAGIENVVASGGTSLTSDQLRNIKKYTNNLTIIYDGDAAGVKAALRGLDMALEESLNVKLVLIPGNEDPDSYLNKIGAKQFEEFIAANKKDFILFQLDVLMKEAGDDVNRKNDVVNKMAETLSKINKLEDFTKQQEYIKQCSATLKIDEGGLIHLVNKYKRENISRENKIFIPENTPAEEIPDALFLDNDELQEKNVLRVLVESGLKKYDDSKTIAQYIFDELEQYDFNNKKIENLYNLYKLQYEHGLEPTAKTLLYNEEVNIRNMVAEITMFPYELSLRWDKIMKSNILNFDNSVQDAQMSIAYFKLRKIKKMFEENQRNMEKAKSVDEQMRLIKLHRDLKEIEITLTKNLGTVIFK